MEENNNLENINPVQEPIESTASQTPQEPAACGCKEEKKSCKALPIVNCILLVGLILIYVLHFTGIGAKNPASKVNADAKPVVTGTDGMLRIAYINTDTLLSKYDYYKDLEKQLKDFQTAKENNYKQQMSQFQKDYDAYIHGGADNLTLAQQQAKEKELQERAQQLSQLEGQLAMQIQERTLQESEKMTNAVYNFIREYNAQNQQFDLIFSRSFSNSPILYGNEGMDITDEILQGLNKEYATVKAEK